MRETIETVRQIARGDRLDHHDEVCDLAPDGSGRGIRSMVPPVAPIPMVIAALGPRNLELTGEIADGWLGNAFIPEHADVFLDPIRIGCARTGRTIDQLDLVMPVAVEFTDDPEEEGRRHADGYAFTVGAMGAPGKNFYNRAFSAQGYSDDVAAVYELCRPAGRQAGRREEAAARVPFDLGFKTNLLGPPEVIRERVRVYRDAGITTLRAKVTGPERLDAVAQLIDLVREVDAERPGVPRR